LLIEQAQDCGFELRVSQAVRLANTVALGADCGQPAKLVRALFVSVFDNDSFGVQVVRQTSVNKAAGITGEILVKGQVRITANGLKN
jgi:hypothetical protein